MLLTHQNQSQILETFNILIKVSHFKNDFIRFDNKSRPIQWSALESISGSSQSSAKCYPSMRNLIYKYFISNCIRFEANNLWLRNHILYSCASHWFAFPIVISDNSACFCFSLFFFMPKYLFHASTPNFDFLTSY
jgi:hypothetical protein